MENTIVEETKVVAKEIVKVEAGPETDNREITCRVCGGPLTGREGKLVLKYFLLRKATRSRRRA